MKRFVAFFLVLILALGVSSCVKFRGGDTSDDHEHTYDTWTILREATCVSSGKRISSCTVCRAPYTEEYENPTAHRYAKTYTADGTDHWFACENEGCSSAWERSAHTWGVEDTCDICGIHKDPGLMIGAWGEIMQVQEYNGDAAEVIIPSEYLGVPVAEIGWSAFYHRSSLRSVKISSNVIWIGSSAFRGCENLASVTLAPGVQRIGVYAFAECSNLTSINFGGTRAEWNAIEKIDEWDAGTNNYTVYCTDGEITK